MFTNLRRRLRVALIPLALGALMAGCGVPTDVPSCQPFYQSQGPHGYVSFQQQSAGARIAWVIRAENPEFQTNGRWNVEVRSDGRKIDGKNTDYAPHGSVNPSDVRPGKLLEVAGNVTSDVSSAKALIRGVCRMT